MVLLWAETAAGLPGPEPVGRPGLGSLGLGLSSLLFVVGEATLLSPVLC
jgi:hypothetical protein